jgi:hypothetical protein
MALDTCLNYGQIRNQTHRANCIRCDASLHSHRVSPRHWHIYSHKSGRFHDVRLADPVRPVDRCTCERGQFTPLWETVDCSHVKEARSEEREYARPVVVDGNGIELFGNDEDDGDPGDAQPEPKKPAPKPEPPKTRATLEDLFHYA